MLVTGVGVLLLVSIQTVIATVMVRFFRVRLRTRWAPVVFSLFLVPLVLVASLLVVGQLPIFVAMDRNTVMLLAILLPLMLGFVIDRFWLRSPEEIAATIGADRSS